MGVPEHRFAIENDKTSIALVRFRRRSLALTGVGLAAEALGSALLVVAGFPEDGPVYWVIIVLIGGGAVPLIGGVMALANSLRMGRALRCHPWQVLPMRYGEVGVGVLPNGQPTLLVGAQAGDRDGVLSLVTFNWRWPQFASLDTVWFAGDLDRGGVVSPDGRTDLAWARSPRMGWWRRSLRRAVLALHGEDL